MKNKFPYACYSCGFVFHKSWCSERVCRVLATSVLQTTHSGFCSERLFIQGKLILPSQRSWRLANVLQVEDVLKHCHSHLWTLAPPCLIPFIVFMGFHLMFSNSPWSRRNIVWAEITYLGFCGDHLIPVFDSLISLPLTHMKSLNFTPTLLQWFPPPLPQAS